MSRSKNISVLEVRVISSCCTAGFIRDADARIDFVVSVANARIDFSASVADARVNSFISFANARIDSCISISNSCIGICSAMPVAEGVPDVTLPCMLSRRSQVVEPQLIELRHFIER